MPELYIIGNGFDKGHGLKTSYWNFREYLEKYEAADRLSNLEEYIKIWKNGTCTQNIEKRQGKCRFGENRFQKISTIWWCMYGYEIAKENISFPNVQAADQHFRLCGSVWEVLF